LSVAATVAVVVSSDAHTIERPARSEIGAPDASKAATVRVVVAATREFHSRYGELGESVTRATGTITVSAS
jgi:hypothetical protein